MRTRNHDQDHEQPALEPKTEESAPEAIPASEAAPPTLEERVAKLEAQMARVAALVGE